jgi:outer membrane autotransporter protein
MPDDLPQGRRIRNATRHRGSKQFSATIVAGLVLMGVVLTSPSNVQAQTVLGTAQTFGVLGAASVTNTGPTIITGDVGVSPGSSITGFPPGSVTPPFTIHTTDAVAGQAQSDNATAYNALKGVAVTNNLTGQNLGGQVLVPGVYGFDSSAFLTGNLTLDAQNNAQATWIFNIGSALITSPASTVSFVNGSVAANGGNVFWLVGSSATLDSTTSFTGNILALTSISLNNGASIICGRALAQVGSVTLINNVIIIPGFGGCAPVTPALPPGVIESVTVTNNLNALLSGGTLTDNQTAVAEAILSTTISNIGNSVIEALSSLSLSQLAAALNAISGEGVSGAQETAFGSSNMFMSTVMGQATFWRDNTSQGFVSRAPTSGPLKLGPTDEGPEASGIIDRDRPGTWRLWAAGFGGTSSLDGNPQNGSADLSFPTVGLASGLDYQINRTTLIGVAGGYSSSDFSVDARRTSGTVEGPHVGLYGVERLGPFYFAGVAEYADFNNDTQRQIFLGGPVPTERANGKFNSQDVSGRIEAGWDLPVGQLNVTPFAGMQWSRLRSDGFTENSVTLNGDKGIFGLKFDSQDETSRLSSLGLQLDTRIALADGMTLSPFARVAWLHEFNPDRSIFATLVSLPAASFAIDGAAAATDAARVNTGLKLALSEHTAVFGFFDGVFSDQDQSYAGTGGVKFTW